VKRKPVASNSEHAQVQSTCTQTRQPDIKGEARDIFPKKDGTQTRRLGGEGEA